ncbi:Nucleotidylyl transferase [Polychaeton citri CBS 116435]|uniref:Tryptophan--tRNA ligase, cytoplasmic n=1 Tax=Polychaeton citri CBS 116435 TaxID=1314669 RepID=A0A9P4UHX2_9PEZI|nr:Nucleotidylyl transferase [Polychaeton citri CBS 116435]
MSTQQEDGVPPIAEKKIEAAEQKIDPYNVAGETDEEGNVKAIDYDRLIEHFGVQPLTDDLLARFEKVTGKPAHRLMRRKLFFSHRDFGKILDVYEEYGAFMLYTGRGPSAGSLHLGHMIPMLFTKELQEIFDVPLVIMLTEDEKYAYTRYKNDGKLLPGNDIGDFLGYAYDNAKDIIALGFDKKKTFIYTDYEYLGGHYQQNASEFGSLISFNQVRGAFGFGDGHNIDLISYGPRQCAAAFPTSYPTLFGYDDYRAPNYPSHARRPSKELAALPTLIPCAIDQEPYFRILRDNCERMSRKSPKTSLILSKFLTALQGPGGKMSASDANSAIYMSDTPNQIKNKINRHAFSGGRESLEEHRQFGGNPDVDVAYTYLSYFLDSDQELEDLATKYRSGELLTGEMKAKCISVLQDFVGAFQERRSKVDDKVMREYMTPRKLEYEGKKDAPKRGQFSLLAQSGEKGGSTEKVEREDGKLTKGEKKAAKLAEKKAQKEAEKKGDLPERPKEATAS